MYLRATEDPNFDTSFIRNDFERSKSNGATFYKSMGGTYYTRGKVDIPRAGKKVGNWPRNISKGDGMRERLNRTTVQFKGPPLPKYIYL